MKSYVIHFIRHGLTEANSKGQYIGSTDVSLSDKGLSQILEMGEKYDYPGAGVFYTSPLKRCIQTCKALYPEVSPVIIDGLKECDFGEWEGKTVKELGDSQEFKNWLNNAQTTPPPGGEGLEDFRARVCTTFEKLVEGLMKSGTTSAVVVTHGGVIMSILATYGLPKANFYDWIADNGCGYSVRITPGLWMRDKVMEVYSKIPTNNQEQRGDNSYIIDIAREAADRAYGDSTNKTN